MTEKTVTLVLRGADAGLNATVKTSDKNVDQLRQTGNRAGQELNRSFRQAGQGVGSLADQVARGQRMLGGFAAAWISMRGAMSLAGIADEYANVTGRLSNVTEGTAQLRSVQDELFESAQRTFTAYLGTADLYARIAQNAGELKKSQSELIEISETINQSFIVSGANGAESAGAIRQLSQAFASGVFRGEEFNSVAEQGPRIMKALTESLDITRGGLRLMADQGQLTAELVIGALQEQSSAIQAEFDNMPLTIGRAMTFASNAIRQYIGEGDQARGVSVQVAEGIVTVAENLDTLATVVTVAGTAYGTHYVVGMTASTVATLAKNAATVKNTAAELAATKTEVARLQVLRSQAGLLSVSGVSTNALTVATQRLTAAETAHAAAVARSRGGLLGLSQVAIGPTGLVAGLAAVGAGLVMLGRRHNAEVEASRRAEAQAYATSRAYLSLKESLDEFGSNPSGDQARAAGMARDLKEQIEGTVQQIRDLRDNYDELSRPERTALANAERSLANFREQAASLVKLHPQLKAFFEVLDTDTGSEAANRAAATLASLQAEIDAYRSGKEAVEAWNREQEMAKSVADLVKDAGEGNREALERLVGTLYDARDAYDAKIAKEREAAMAAEAVANANREAEQQVAIMTRQISLVEQGMDADRAATQARLEANKVSADTIQKLQELGQTWDDLTDKKAPVEPFQDLRDVMLSLEDDWGRSVANIVQGFENIAKGSDTAVRGYAQVAQGAADMFDQHTAGYRILSVASQAARAIEIAGAVESLAVSLASEQTKQAAQGQSLVVHLATEAAKATASGISAVASSMVGLPFPANLAAMGATIAALAGVGVMLSGGGGGGSAPRLSETSRGRGTVLGDSNATSSSIENTLGSIESLTEKSLGISQGMLQSLRAIEAGTQRAGAAVIQDLWQIIEPLRRGEQINFAPDQTFGSIATSGLAGSVSGQIWDQRAINDLSRDPNVTVDRDLYLGGATVSAGIGERLGMQLAGVFDDMSDSLLSAGDMLGRDRDMLRQQIEALVLPLDGLDLQGLNAEEAAERVNDAFSAAFDIAATQIAPWVTNFQRPMEGAGETLVRVSTQTAVLRDAVDALGMSSQLADGHLDVMQAQLARFMPDVVNDTMAMMDEARIAGIADSIASLMGGVDELAGGVESFLELTLTAPEQFNRLQGSLDRSLSEVGLSVPQSADDLRDLARSLDLTTDAGQRGYATLLQLSDQFDDLFDTLQARADFSQDIQRQIELLQADNPDLVKLEHRFTDLRAEAEELGGGPLLDLVNQLYDLEAAALETGGSLAGLSESIRTSLQDELASHGLEGGQLELFRLDRWMEDMLAQAGQNQDDIALIEMTGAQRRLDIISAMHDAAILEAQREAEAAYAFDTALSIADGMDPLRLALLDLGLTMDGLQGAARNGLAGIQGYLEGLDQAGRAALSGFTSDILSLIPDTAAATVQSVSRSVSSAAAQSLPRQSDWSSIADSMRDWVSSQRRNDTISPEQNLHNSLQDFFRTANQARNKDEDALRAITGIGNDVLGSLDQAATEFEAKRIRATVLGTVGSLADRIDPVQIQQDQLDTLTDIRDLLRLGQRVRLDAPGFASGGFHAGGYRWVGEDGPELEFTGASHILSNLDSRALIAAANNRGGGDASAQLAQIEAAIQELRALLYQIAKSSGGTEHQLKKWAVERLAEESEEVAA